MKNTMDSKDLNTVEFLDGILSRKNFKSAEEEKQPLKHGLRMFFKTNSSQLVRKLKRWNMLRC